MSIADDYKVIKSYRREFEPRKKIGFNDEIYLDYEKSLERVYSYLFSGDFNIGEVITKLAEIIDFDESNLKNHELNVKTFRRIKNGKVKVPHFHTILSICVAMHLPTPISEKIIYGLGYFEMYLNPNNSLYKDIIECYYDDSIFIINEMLYTVNLKLL